MLILIGMLLLSGFWYVSRFTSEQDLPRLSSGTERDTSHGPVTGFQDDGVDVWLGIPFASPPIGELRWKAPRPPEPWKESLPANQFGSECPQNMVGFSGDEDCLYLNVWSPAESKDLAPVMFFIHGGGNHLGSANAGGLYDGQRFASKFGVVLVSIHYRLGPLGWFSHPSFLVGDKSDWAKKDESGNYGTLDILAALEWTRDNIERFGGDPENVTIFGESAGGFDVLSMMISPLAKGLYHKAIVQSGGIRIIPMDAAQNYRGEGAGHQLSAREFTNQLLVEEGLAIGPVDARGVQEMMSDEKIRDFLLGRSAESILAAQGAIRQEIGDANKTQEAPEPFVLWGATNQLSPTLLGDGYVLPKDLQIKELLSDPERYNATPVMLGSNRDESKLFMMMEPHYTHRLFGVPVWTKNEEDYEIATEYGSLFWKADAVDELAMVLTESQDEGVYAYRFDWDDLRSFITLDLRSLMGAAHALELPFVFGNLDLLDKALVLSDYQSARELSDRMMSYWSEFAHSGSPGRGKDGALLGWTEWKNDAGSAKLMLLDSSLDSGTQMVSSVVTYATIADKLIADDRLDTGARCRLARRMFDEGLSDRVCLAQ